MARKLKNLTNQYAAFRNKVRKNRRRNEIAKESRRRNRGK